MFKIFQKGFIAAILGLTLMACGVSSNTAWVTLSTGLEDHSLPNLLDPFLAAKALSQQFTLGANSCLQKQVYAAWQPAGQSGSTSALSLFPVSLSTPEILSSSGNAVGDFSQTSLSNTSFSSLAGWLKASTLQPIRIPVPTNLPISLGIYGALYLPKTLDTDGVSCAPTDGNYAYDSAALASYTGPLTISGNTNVPLNLWVTRASAGHSSNNLMVATELPTSPNTPVCNSSNGAMSGALSQTCPSLNFEKVKLACAAGDTNCTSNLIQFDYLNAINGPQHITHLMDRSKVVAAAPLGAVLPSLTPMQITLGTSSALRNQNSGNTISISPLSSVIFSGFSAAPNPNPNPNPATQALLGDFLDIVNNNNSLGVGHCIQVTVTLQDSMGAPATLTPENNGVNLGLGTVPPGSSVKFYTVYGCPDESEVVGGYSLNSNPTTLWFKVLSGPAGYYTIRLTPFLNTITPASVIQYIQ